jgi:hypothetical protein
MDTLYDQETYWEPVTRIVFYEPRTIPPAWDVSVFMETSKGLLADPGLAKEKQETQ